MALGHNTYTSTPITASLEWHIVLLKYFAQKYESLVYNFSLCFVCDTLFYSCQQWWYGSWPWPLHIWCAGSRYESSSLIPRLPHSKIQTLNLCRCREPGIFWAFGYAHVQLKSFYPFGGAHVRKKYQALHACTSSMFMFWSVGAWERGYETSSCTCTLKKLFF